MGVLEEGDSPEVAVWADFACVGDFFEPVLVVEFLGLEGVVDDGFVLVEEEDELDSALTLSCDECSFDEVPEATSDLVWDDSPVMKENSDENELYQGIQHQTVSNSKRR